MADAGGGAPTGGAQQRRARTRVLLAAVVLVLAVGAAVAVLILGTPRGAGTAPSTTQTATSPAPSAGPSTTVPALPPGALNVLVMGSDIRGNAREAIAQQQVTGQTADQRSDMIMLVHVPADRSRVFGISIMRDTWVDIPGHGEAKINAALALGGPELAARTVGQLLSTRIDHYALLDFDGFKAVTDAFGGIDVDVPVAFTATFDTHHAFVRGTNHLDGQAALEFVRERYAFPDGDYQRVRDQQAFVRAVMVRLVRRGEVAEPVAAIAVVRSVLPYLVVDPGFDESTLAALGYALRHTDPAAAALFTLPTAGTGTSADGQSIVFQDEAGISEVAAALASDGLGAYATAHGF